MKHKNISLNGVKEMGLPLECCTGCYACVNICPRKCITMKIENQNFSAPRIDTQRCVACGMCEGGCPVLHMPEINIKTTGYAMKSRNERDRRKSTSGGVFSLLAEYVIKEGGVVYGVAYAPDFSAHHIAITERQELSLLQGAKYTQSVIGKCFSKIKSQLRSECLVLFSGTPCQCAGLKSFLGKKYSNLITVDIICHGVPSPKVWQAYIDYRSQKENNGVRPQRINMRSKVSGWSRYGYSTEFDYGNGKITHIHNSQDLFMQAFIGNICLRNSCSNCKTKGVERCTDFTLGDYWGIWNQHPEFDDNKGTSVVFVHSQKGREILEQLSDKIDCLEVNLEDACKENSSLMNSSKPHPGREEFLAQVTAENFEELVRKYFSQENVQKSGTRQKNKRNQERIWRLEMKDLKRKIIEKYYRLLPNRVMSRVENYVKNKDQRALLEGLRLEKFINNTDFDSLDTSKYPVCYIRKATWDYPLFHMYFIVNMLDNIIYCLSKGYKPIVQFKNSENTNLWEQFLEQPCGLQYNNELASLECDELDANLHWPLYPTRNEISIYAKLYHSFVKPNKQTQKYFDNEYETIIKGKRVLGVLCRGTDYTANKPKGHPVQPPVDDVIALVKLKMVELDCQWIYLATEERAILEQFEKSFPQQILVNKRNYFDEFYEIKKREGENARISWVHFGREKDSYYKSLEYFSSVNLLSKCTALIAGNCGGSRTALYLNNNKYEYWHLFDLGVY